MLNSRALAFRILFIFKLEYSGFQMCLHVGELEDPGIPILVYAYIYIVLGLSGFWILDVFAVWNVNITKYFPVLDSRSPESFEILDSRFHVEIHDF